MILVIKMNKLFITIASFLLLTACVPNTTNGQKMDNSANMPKSQTNHHQNPTLTAKMVKHPQGKTATPDEIAECHKQGGKISRQGLAQHDFCVVEFADKGKVCTDGGECQSGRCIVNLAKSSNEIATSAKGVCASNNSPFGCYGTVNKGKFGGFLCVD